MSIQRRACALELKTVGDTGEFSGYGSTFGNVDLDGDIVLPGAFAESLKSMATDGQMPGLFWQHDHTSPIGEWTAVSEDERGLLVTGKLWVGKGIVQAEQAFCMLKAKGPKGLSIGYVAQQYDIDRAKQIRLLRQVGLREISVVTFPANPQAQVTGIKASDLDGLTTSILRARRALGA